MKDLKELRIWQKGINIGENCFKIVKDIPRQVKFGPTIQITRSGVSISAK